MTMTNSNPPQSGPPIPNTELREAVKTAIEDVFVYTLEVKLDEDVPMLTDNIMQLIQTNQSALIDKIIAAMPEKIDPYQFESRLASDGVFPVKYTGYNQALT